LVRNEVVSAEVAAGFREPRDERRERRGRRRRGRGLRPERQRGNDQRRADCGEADHHTILRRRPRRTGYSDRSAVTGFTRVARNAGRYVASAPTPPSTDDTITSIGTSPGSTP